MHKLSSKQIDPVSLRSNQNIKWDLLC